MEFLSSDGPALSSVRERLVRGTVYARRVKPALDRLAAAFMLLLLSPLLAAVALAVLIDSGLPVLFTQERVGQYGRRIHVVRYRTVDTSSELWQRTLAGAPVDPGWDQAGLTRVGRWLLRTKLDRLAELFNVLRGDMSVVGPRPAMPHELATYGHLDWIRLRARPGVTCLWQISETAANVVEASRDIDQDYVFNVSFRTDVSILARTFRVLFAHAHPH